MNAFSAIVRFFQEGGLFMYPIVIVLALGLAIAIERWLYLTMATASNKSLWNKVAPYLKSGNLSGAMQVTSKSKAAIAQIMTYGLNRVRSARRCCRWRANTAHSSRPRPRAARRRGW